VIDGAKQLAWVEDEFQDDERQVFRIFRKVADDARDYPEGPMRKHWAADALVRKDRERAELEARARHKVETACRALLDRWGGI